MAKQNTKPLDGVLASLPPENLDQLCALIIAKLEGRNQRGLAFQARRRGFESHHPPHYPELAQLLLD